MAESKSKREKFDRGFYYWVIRNYLKKDPVLDVGCGQGNFLRVCEEEGVRAIGIDTDKQSIVHCKKRGLDVKYGSAYKLPFKSNMFNGIFCANLIEHLQHPEKAIREFYRVLMSKGFLVITTPRPNVWFWDDPTHVKPYTENGLRRLVTGVNYPYQKGSDLELVEITYAQRTFRLLNSHLFVKLVGILPFKVTTGQIVLVVKKSH